MTKKVDKDQNFMKSEWGTQYLSSEYGWDEKVKQLEASSIQLGGNHLSHGVGFHSSRMLREIANDALTPKKHDFYHQNEIHSRIRNDNDYDDWEYGTEPLYESKKPE
jgi:hypothetical protein